MKRVALLLICLWFFSVGGTEAVVEIGPLGSEPMVLEDVYQREGTSFIAIQDVLAALELEGSWDSVAHTFRIRTPHGWAVISPGSQFLKLGDNFVPIAHRPRFIDGKLRVSEVFIQQQLAPLLAGPVHYRNYDPPDAGREQDPLDRLFAFLLRKQEPARDQGEWVVALDPGHGGKDPGALGAQGSKEKTVNLAVAQRLEKLLKMHQDAPVVLTRDADYAIDLRRRLEIVIEAAADVLLSLHTQAFFNSGPRGIMLYVGPPPEPDIASVLTTVPPSRKLARHLQQALVEAEFIVHGIQAAPLRPLGRGDLPRVLIELGNLGNQEELTMLQDPTRQQDIARALFDGLQSYFQSEQEMMHEQPDRQPHQRSNR